MNNLISQIAQNAVFVLVFAGVIILMFLIAYAVEKLIKKKNDDKERILTTRKVVVIGMFSALSTVLMLFEFLPRLSEVLHSVPLRAS